MTKRKEYTLAGRKIFIALPAYDHKVSIKLAISLARLAQMVGEHGVNIAIGSICGCSVVSKARNLLADEFLSTDCTDLLFIDADINFEPEDVLRLLAWTTNYGIAAGVPRTRKKNGNYIITLDEDEDHSLVTDDMGCAKAKRVATAFMMVQRKVFETLRDAHPEWKYHDTNSGKTLTAFFDFKVTPEGYIGEDYLFCDRTREHGFEVWVDPTIKLGHMGVIEYEGDFGRDAIYTKKAVQSEFPPAMSDVA